MAGDAPAGILGTPEGGVVGKRDRAREFIPFLLGNKANVD